MIQNISQITVYQKQGILCHRYHCKKNLSSLGAHYGLGQNTTSTTQQGSYQYTTLHWGCCNTVMPHSCTHTHTHTHTTVSWPSVRDYPGEPVPEETFTHSHLSWSSTIPYQLPPSTMIHTIFPVQLMCLIVFCTTSLQVLFGLSPGLEPPHFILHTFLHPFLLFAIRANNISTCFTVILRLCHLILVYLSTLYLKLYIYLSVTHPSDHSRLCLLKCHLILFSYRPGLTSMQHTTSHTTTVQSPSPYQWYIPIGKQWYQLPEYGQLYKNMISSTKPEWNT